MSAEMKPGTPVVDKARYDLLLRKYFIARRKNRIFQSTLVDLRDAMNHIDDRVLEDVHHFSTLEEENAYLIGACNAMKALRWTMTELEEKYEVPTDQQ